MNRSAVPLAGTITAILLLLSAAPGLAAELTLSGAEVENLGIELTTPRLTEHAAGIPGRGRVAIPPAGDVTVSSPQPGLLVRLHAAVGDPVSAGQILAEVRSPRYVATQREFLDAVTADALARARLARDRSLVAEGIVSRRRLEQSEAESEATAAARAAHRQMLRLDGLDDADIDALATDRELKGVLPIRATIDGVVLGIQARAGTGITETDPLFRIGDLSTLWLEIDVSQADVDHIDPGMWVTVDGSSAARGRVDSIGRVVNPRTQLVTVRARVVSGEHALRPGQFIAARIVDGAAARLATPVWSVPTSSVVRRDSGHFVFVRSESGFDVRSVERLGAEGDRIFVAGALDDDTRLAASGVSALKALWNTAADEAP